jgi:hypothetical protein
MQTPKFEAHRININGKPAIELVVRNSLANAELHAIIDSLGYAPTVGIANRRSIICSTPTEIDSARNPLVRFFDAKGNFI